MTIAIVLVAATAAAVVLSGGLIRAFLSAHARPGQTAAAHLGHRHSGPLAAVGHVVRVLLRAGVPLGPVMLLTVPGRRTGIPRTTPIDVFEHDGRRWLVATHAVDAAWVCNLRAAQHGSLTRGRRRIDFTATEIPPQEAADLLASIAGPRLNRRIGGLALRRTLALTPDSDHDAYQRVTAEHPLFELDVAAETVPDRPQTVFTVLITGGILIAAAHLVLGLTGALGTAGWVSGVVIGALTAGIGNHLRIFGLPNAG
jgi:deazaflavin-dependent oxidoreductase (nitroreductase family)